MIRLILGILLLFFSSPVFAIGLGPVGARIVAGGGGAGTVSYSSIGTVAHVEANTDVATTAPSNSSGDLLIAVVSDDTDQALTDFDGFTLITSQSQSSHRLSVGYIVADGTTAYTFVSGSSEKTAVILRLTKDDGTWNIADYDSASASASEVDLPALTVDQDDSMVIVAYGNDDNFGTDTNPSDDGMTVAVEYTAADPRMSVFYQAADTGTFASVSVDPTAASDATLIGIVVEAEE